MGHVVLNDAKVWVAGFDLSGDLNALAVRYGVDAKDDTNFGDTTQVHLAGRRQVRAELQGRYDAGASAIDKVLFDRIGTVDVPFSFNADGGAAGEIAYTFKAMAATLNIGGEHGEVAPIECSAVGTGELVRGTILFNGTATTTGTGTAYGITGPDTGQLARASLHVLAASGTAPTLDVVVESDTDSGFGSGVSRITFAQATGVTAEYKESASGIGTAEDNWRISYTIGGTSPSFTFVVVLGIK